LPAGGEEEEHEEQGGGGGGCQSTEGGHCCCSLALELWLLTKLLYRGQVTGVKVKVKLELG
jgi:hypothetical protein